MTDQSVDLAELKRLAEILANRPTEGQVTGGEQMRETIEAYVVFTKPQVILFILAQLAEAQRRERVLVVALWEIAPDDDPFFLRGDCAFPCYSCKWATPDHSLDCQWALARIALHKVGALES